jgi:hypothetical protein
MRMVFKADGDFGAFYAAEKWCCDNGYSVGSMERDRPIGLAKGNYDISKWHNLGSDKQLLDGVIAEGSKRENDVTVIIFDDVDQKGVYQ